MSTDMAINPWTIRASHAPLEVHASHFSTLRTSVNPTLDGPNPPPSTGWSQLSVISSFHHQKFQTKPGHMIIYRIRALLQKKKHDLGHMIGMESSKVSDKWLEPICSWTTSSVTCILPGTKTKSGSPGVSVKFTSIKRPGEPSPAVWGWCWKRGFWNEEISGSSKLW